MHDAKYDEKPDHGHYVACAERSTQIYEFSRNVFVYTGGVCLVMLFITYCGAAMPLVSWIPSLFGCPTCVPFLFTQTAELILVTLAAFLAFGKWKILHIGLFIGYVLLVVATFFSSSGIGIITFIIGVVGTVLTAPSFKVYSDYNQLVNTEGWPHFSLHYTDSLEHPTYTSRYMSEYRSAPDDKRITADETAASRSAPVLPEMADIEAPEPVMEDIPLIGAAPVPDTADTPELPDGEMFVPDSGLSDEPFDIQ
ncbi:hypothetical protein SAMN02910353_02074 [Ruminococcus sp. YRD2003]|uniref:hypothetical protein n=1 Tax=Ruminococcus sp. YRD2003 TaxID=1452313 RepID=UPI0008ABC7B4|nr:hypothetical protein SAMN02910353_02074 [Ruminococcus flavefaciens]